MGSAADFGENRQTPPAAATGSAAPCGASPWEGRLKIIAIVFAVAFAAAPVRAAEEPDHAIHEELRSVLHEILGAINSGEYNKMLPYMAPNVEVTSVTQEVMSSREDVAKYFVEWFGPSGYMKSMSMKLDADKLTEFSPDKNWGLVRGKAAEHYEAKDGDQFDFATRWTALMARGDDGKWRLRAIHFGTNHLDNPVLTKVSRTLLRYVYIASAVCLALGLGVGWWFGRRSARRIAVTA
jgi:ketosteroid isomerase-like protein